MAWQESKGKGMTKGDHKVLKRENYYLFSGTIEEV